MLDKSRKRKIIRCGPINYLQFDYCVPANTKTTLHYSDVIMTAIASQVSSLTIVYSIAYSDTDQRKHQSSVSLASVRAIHRWPVNSPHKRPVKRKMFQFDNVIMWNSVASSKHHHTVHTICFISLTNRTIYKPVEHFISLCEWLVKQFIGHI